MDVSLLIRLIDQVTGPAKKVGDALTGIGKKAKELGREAAGGFATSIRQGFSAKNIEEATRNAEQALSRARGRLMGAIGLALTLAAPLKGLTAFEDRLVDFGNVAGIYGDNLAKIETDLRALGPQVNKTAGEMLAALEYLVGKGLSPEQGMAALRAVGMTATATKAEVEDMAAAGYAVLDNLRVPVEQLQLAFDAMAQAGKNGGFELKDMAQYFPMLTASAQALGMDGVDAVAELAAALQIAMKGAGDPSTAANNMQNFLLKLSSPETVKRFEKLGVDIKKEFEIAEKNGVSVFEHMLQRIREITGGDPFKIGELFGDQQVLNFLKPLMANMDEFREIRNAAMKSAGVNERDFQRVMATGAASAKQLVVQLDNLLSKGSPLLDLFKQVTAQLIAALKAMNDFAAAHPELTANLVKAGAALVSLMVAGRLLSFVIASIRLPLIGLISTFLKFDAAGRNVAIGWRLLSGAARGLGGAGRFAAGSLRNLADRVGGLRNVLRGGIFAGWAVPLAFEFVDDMGRTPEQRLEEIQKKRDAWRKLEQDVDASSFGQWWRKLQAGANAMMGLEADQVPAEAFMAWLGRGWDQVDAQWTSLSANVRAKAAEMGTQALAGLEERWASVEQWFLTQKAWLEQAWADLDLSEVARTALETLLAGFASTWASIESWITEKTAWLKNAFNFEFTPPSWWPSFLGGQNENDPVSRTVANVSGGGEPPGPSPIAEAARQANQGGGGTVGSFLSGMDSAASTAADDMARGGAQAERALARGGEVGGKAIEAAAQHFAAIIEKDAAKAGRALQNSTGSGGRGGSVASELAASLTGALHGGTE